MMRKLTKLEKFGMAASIVVIATYFYMSKIYDPESLALKTTVENLNKVIKKANSIGNPPDPSPLKIRNKYLRKKLKTLTEMLQELGGRGEAVSELTKVMAEISRISDRANLKVKSMSEPTVKESDNFSWAVYSMEVTGSYSSLLNFLSDLKEMNFPVKVEEIVIEKDPSVKTPGLLNIKFKLMV